MTIPLITTFEIVLAWVGVGLAASLAGMILPFKRGVLGVVINAMAGVTGAVFVAGTGWAMGLYRHGWGISMLLATVGAITGLVAVHLAWSARVQRAHHH